jgi:hypothetical protein
MGLRTTVLLAGAALLGAGCGGGDEDGRPSPREARQCLEDLGIHVTIDRLPGGGGAPERELVANDILLGRVMLYVQYHDHEDGAERYERTLRREARRHDWRAERHGTLTLLWRAGQESRAGRRARGCVL